MPTSFVALLLLKRVTSAATPLNSVLVYIACYIATKALSLVSCESKTVRTFHIVNSKKLNELQNSSTCTLERTLRPAKRLSDACHLNLPDIVNRVSIGNSFKLRNLRILAQERR